MIALMFPGQGSQAVGMGRDLYEAHESARFTYEAASTVLGYDMAELSFEGPADKLSQTEFTQPALLTHSVATLRVLQERDFAFDLAFGHSLGEYSALVATDALGFDDALRLVKRRGEAMTAAAARQPGSMAAVLGLDADMVEELCEGIADVWPANFNSPGQVVVSGSEAGVEALGAAALAAGAKRCLKLQRQRRLPFAARGGGGRRPASAARADGLRRAHAAVLLGLHGRLRGRGLRPAAAAPGRLAGAFRAVGPATDRRGIQCISRGGSGRRPGRPRQAHRTRGGGAGAGDPESLERVVAGWPQIEGGGTQ